LKTDLVEALSEMTTVGRSKITKQRAVINRLVENAMGRNAGDIKLLLTLYLQICGIENEQERDDPDTSRSLEEFHARLEAIRERMARKVGPDETPSNPEK